MALNCVKHYTQLVLNQLDSSDTNDSFDDYLASCEEPSRQFNIYKVGKNDFEGIISLESPEICSRIIGRRGCNICYIRKVVSIKIGSPRIEGYNSTNSFSVQSTSLTKIYAIAYIIFLLADYFQSRMKERIALKNPTDLRVSLPVEPPMVPLLLVNKGAYLVGLRKKYSVNIVSPKPYSTDCRFYIIGDLVDVCYAQSELLERIDELTALSESHDSDSPHSEQSSW